MQFDCIEHSDDFEDAVIFWLEISNVPLEIESKAKLIDGDNFLSSCFGMCVNYDKEKKIFCIITDNDLETNDENNIYYVNNNGDKIWYKINLEDSFVTKIFEECGKELKLESI